MKKIISVLVLFLCAACGHRSDAGKVIDPFENSGKLGVEDRSNQEPITLVDQDVNLEESDHGSLDPVFFGFDEAQVGGDQIPVLQSNANTLQKIVSGNLLIEGYCDERGTEEYNLALGDRGSPCEICKGISGVVRNQSGPDLYDQLWRKSSV